MTFDLDLTDAACVMPLDVHPCTHPGCTSTFTIACEEPRDWLETEASAALDDEPSVTWYCPDHAEENGFCRDCGVFCAGIETFDFGRYPGHCDNCQDAIRNDSDPCDDYEGEYPW